MHGRGSTADHGAPMQEGHLRSFVKAASWRLTGTIDTFILSYVFTGSAALAGSIALTEVATKLVLFYLHERAWNRISWGRSARPHKGLRTSPAVTEATAFMQGLNRG